MPLFGLFGPPNIEKLKEKRDVKGLAKALAYRGEAKYTHGGAPVLRSRAAKALGELKDDRATEPLIAALSDDNRGVRDDAASALGELKDRRAVEPLITALEDEDEDGGVRCEAAWALGKIGDHRAVDHLIVASRYPGDFAGASANELRVPAVDALGDLGDVRAVESLIEGLRDSYANMRSAAARALGELGDQRAVEPLIAALRGEYPRVDSFNPGVFEDWGTWVAGALVKLGELAVEPLRSALEDDFGPGGRDLAAWALRKLTDPRAVEPLRTAQGDILTNPRVEEELESWIAQPKNR